MFKAEHADRLAKVTSQVDLSDGDLMFRWYNHMMIFLHAETYFHHYELGLMPAKHWSGYVKYVTDYLSTPDVDEFWSMLGQRFLSIFQSGSISGWKRGSSHDIR